MRSTKIIKNCSSSLCTCLHHMVILRTRNKITDFFMILAWASPFNKTIFFFGTCYYVLAIRSHLGLSFWIFDILWLNERYACQGAASLRRAPGNMIHPGYKAVRDLCAACFTSGCFEVLTGISRKCYRAKQCRNMYIHLCIGLFNHHYPLTAGAAYIPAFHFFISTLSTTF